MPTVLKDGVIKDRKYLDSLRDEPCIITGLRAQPNDAVDPCHVGTAGKGLKTDNEALPLLHSLHALGHQKGEMRMWREKMPDWLLRACLRAYARELYAEWKEAQ